MEDFAAAVKPQESDEMQTIEDGDNAEEEKPADDDVISPDDE